MKNLIVYFSHAGQNYFSGGYRTVKEGNAKILARKLSEIVEADMFEIQTVKKYSEDYKTCCDEALAEQRAGELPELAKDLDSIEQYDNIILCYPCWWGTCPQAVFTFLSQHDFGGKHIYPLCTHEGSGMGRSEADIQKACTGAAVERGLAVQGSYASDADDKLKAWLKNL